jgi:hypothetical protein
MKKAKETINLITAKALAARAKIPLRTIQYRARKLGVVALGGTLVITPEQSERITTAWQDGRTANRKPESELKADSRHKRTFRDKRKAESE